MRLLYLMRCYYVTAHFLRSRRAAWEDKGMERIIMTGPTGAIGIALIQECINRGIEVYAICRRGSARAARIPEHEGVHVVGCDLDELDQLDVARIPQCDVFYHFGWMATIGAARNDTSLQMENIRCTLHAVELAERMGCRTFVGAGSQAEYGRVEGDLSAATPVFPENAYGIAKLCAGQLSRIECEKRGIRHIWARILSVYGPYDSDRTMIITTIRHLLSGERPSLTPGEQRWDYLYSCDAARAMLLMGEKGRAGGVYCVGSGKARPLKDYIITIRNLIDPGAELGFGDVPYGERQVMYLCADLRELTEDTGFIPLVDFEAGIAETIRWVKSGAQI